MKRPHIPIGFALRHQARRLCSQIPLPPADTPKPVVTRLAAELKVVMAMAEVQHQIKNLGIVPVVNEPPEMLQAYINSEMICWGNVVRQIGRACSEG